MKTYPEFMVGLGFRIGDRVRLIVVGSAFGDKDLKRWREFRRGSEDVQRMQQMYEDILRAAKVEAGQVGTVVLIDPTLKSIKVHFDHFESDEQYVPIPFYSLALANEN